MPARDYIVEDAERAYGCALLTKSDTVDLTNFPLSLRIYNPDAAAATIKIDTVRGDTITLTVPAQSLTVEPIVVARIHSTGTSANLVIHGYY